MHKILVVDDEPAILTLLEYNLTQAGYTVEKAERGNEAFQMIQTTPYDLIILDVMLPDMDGMDICRRVRQLNIETPIIMLTARDQEYDKILGLEFGADDYMTKPFSPREVIARMKAILRRTEARNTEDEWETQEMLKEATDIELEELSQQSESYRTSNEDEESVIQLGDILIYRDRYEVEVRGEKVDITPKEFELLVYMALRKGRVLSREQLLDNIWNFDYVGETRIVDVHISHLREKIEEDTKNPKYIITQRGFGYRFEVPGE